MITYDITVMFYNGNITEMAKNVFLNAVAAESQDFGSAVHQDIFYSPNC